MGSSLLFSLREKSPKPGFPILKDGISQDACLSHASIPPASEEGKSTAFGNGRDTILCSHLHNPSIITLAESCGKQKCTSTNYSLFPQWAALNRTLANGTKTFIKKSNKEQGKRKEKTNLE
jgi:hypothetical protein